MIMAMEEGREVDILQEVMRYSGMEAGELLDSGPDWPRNRANSALGAKAEKCALAPFFCTLGGPHTRARDKRRGGDLYVF